MKAIKAALIAAVLVLTSLIATAPAAHAAVGTRTHFTFQVPVSAWVHFRPTLDSPYTEVTQTELYSVCKLNDTWGVVYDAYNARVGFTYNSYVSPVTSQQCWNAGRATDGVPQETWVHLKPTISWGHDVMLPGHSIAAICSMGNIEDVDGRFGVWNLYLDHTTDVVGFTWAELVAGSYVLPDCG